MILRGVKARKILDSRKKYTIEVSINGIKASSPSGKSTGSAETPMYKNSLEWVIKFLNKQDFNLELNSFEDLKILERDICKRLNVKDPKKLGANALFALESVILKTMAKEKNVHLWKLINPRARKIPTPLGNSVGGGLHSEGYKDHPTFQEFLLIPKGKSFKEKLKNMNSIYNKLGKLIKSKKKNDEGAWQTSFNNEQVLEAMSKFSDKSKIGLDIAANSFYEKKKKTYNYKNRELDRTTQIHYINSLIKKYNIYYAEDPLDEKDITGFSKIEKRYLVCGDDLTATHLHLLKKALKKKAINSMIIKPNQNGSLIELKEIIEYCKKNNVKTILSHRSGETLDNAIADYAVAFQTDFVKFGVSTKWREVKLSRLLEIEKSLN